VKIFLIYLCAIFYLKMTGLKYDSAMLINSLPMNFHNKKQAANFIKSKIDTAQIAFSYLFFNAEE